MWKQGKILRRMRLSSSFRIGFQAWTLVDVSLLITKKPVQACSLHQFSHFMTIKFEKKISEYSQKKINNQKKEIKSLLMSMIGKKSTAGMKLEEGEKANLRKQLPGWEPPRQLPKFSKGGICSTKQMTNHQTQHSMGLNLNVTTPSGQKGRGRPRKRKRSERLTDSEEESEEEVV